MSYDPNNIFARIIRGELPCTKVYEDESVLAFNDIHPSAPVHVLVLPKGEYKSFDDFAESASADEMKHFYSKVREIAHKLGVEKTGYRLVMNHGADASQAVPHYHVHILGKRSLGGIVSGDVTHG